MHQNHDHSLEEGSSQIGKGGGGAKSDILTAASFLEKVERHFPHLTISNHAIANGAGRSRSASVAHAQNGDCATLHPHVHFTPDYSDMTIYGGPFADGKTKRTFLNRQGKVVRGSYGNTYKFNNKPNGVYEISNVCRLLSFLTLGHINISHLLSIISGLHHWAESFLANDDRRDEAIVLIDPDFLFLNTFEFPENTPPVLPKKPAAAKYGLGGQVRTFSSLHHLRT
jgi:hypothetical protein